MIWIITWLSPSELVNTQTWLPRRFGRGLLQCLMCSAEAPERADGMQRRRSVGGQNRRRGRRHILPCIRHFAVQDRTGGIPACQTRRDQTRAFNKYFHHAFAREKRRLQLIARRNRMNC